jgi:hypothetical protein
MIIQEKKKPPKFDKEEHALSTQEKSSICTTFLDGANT